MFAWRVVCAFGLAFALEMIFYWNIVLSQHVLKSGENGSQRQNWAECDSNLPKQLPPEFLGTALAEMLVAVPPFGKDFSCSFLILLSLR